MTNWSWILIYLFCFAQLNMKLCRCNWKINITKKKKPEAKTNRWYHNGWANWFEDIFSKIYLKREIYKGRYLHSQFISLNFFALIQKWDLRKQAFAFTNWKMDEREKLYKNHFEKGIFVGEHSLAAERSESFTASDYLWDSKSTQNLALTQNLIPRL